MSINQVIICEKPSLGRAVADALAALNGGKIESNSQYIKVGDDYVTWFAGHVYRLASPKAYYDDKWKYYSLASLPIVVNNNDWKMEADEKKLGLIKTVRDLAKKAKTIVNCGDPDREGQLLVDEALQEWGIDPFSPNVMRYWAQDISLEPMKKAIKGVFPNKEKKTLYYAGVARSRADWEHGMTFSRAYQMFAKMGGATDQTISVGRVQTPALYLIVMRDLERANFKPVQHFKGEAVFKHENGSFKTTWIMPSADDIEARFPNSIDTEGRLIKKDIISEVLEKVNGQQGKVLDYSSKLKPVQQPLGFDLATIQRDAGRKLNMTGKEVLDTLQLLYEQKITSYPRTDSPYLTQAILDDQAPATLNELSKIPELSDLVAKCDRNIKSPIWNNSKVDSHNAIIPAVDFNIDKFNALTGKQREIFLMVARRLIAQFYPPHTYYSLSATVECEGERFKGSGQRIKTMGWKSVYLSSGNDEEDDESSEDKENDSFPEMAKGDDVTETGHKINALMTSPPPAFNDSNFIGKGGALEKVYLFEKDPEIKKRLKEAEGLGRPATRANIIETLLKREFIKRKGKTGLESTELGRSIISIMPDRLVSVGMTAIWENKFDDIEAGDLTLDDFMDEMSANLTKMVAEDIEANPNGVKLKGVKITIPLEGDGKPCPECEKAGRSNGVMRTVQGKSKATGKLVKFLACSNNIKQPDGSYLCGYRELPQKPVKKRMEGDGDVCPKCGKGHLTTREWVSKKDNKERRALFCDQGRDICDFIKFDNSDRPKVKNSKGPMEGDGQECPKCHKGHMHTREWHKDGEDKRAMFCDNESCKHAIWDNNVKPIEGDGQKCGVCGKGVMKTKSYMDKKTKKRAFFLGCNRYPECRNAIFPKK